MFKVNVKEKNQITIIQIIGAFYIDSLSQIEAVWKEQIAKKPETIGIDCTELVQIDSAAIGHMVKYLNSAINNDINMIFYNLNIEIQKLFDKTKLNHFFSIITKDEFEKEYLTCV